MTHGLPSKHAVPVAPLQSVSLATCGIPLATSAPRLLASETALARLLGQLSNVSAGGLAVALRVGDLGSSHDAPERLALVCAKIGHAFHRAGLDPKTLEITIDAAALAPQAAWKIRRAALGVGTLNLVFDDAIMSSVQHSERAAANGFWLQLWHLRQSSVVSAFWPSVRSRCALLSSESATDVVPGVGLQAPTQSAWLSYELDLLEFADAAGAIEKNAVELALERCINAAEEMYDKTAWPTPAMQQDAWFNRRLAIRIVGIGDIALRRGLDPELHASVRQLDQLIRHIRCTAERYSQQMAQTSETLPAILAANPCTHLRPGCIREAWEGRWSEAIKRSATRYRNLIVMSPWSIFPRNCADYRYVNLLPLLAHADACEFRRSISLADWNAMQFIHFYRRAWAVRASVESSTVVAERL